MRLQVFTPEERLLDTPVTRIVAEAVDGSFGLLERHIDMVAPLTAGILVYDDAGGTGYVGLDEGLLVKCGAEVSVAVRRAVIGRDLDELREVLRDELLAYDEHERAARGALVRLEAGVVRRILDLERQG